MSCYRSLVTRQLISVQDFAFRGWPMSLFVAYAPGGSLTYSVFPAGAFAMPSRQQLETITHMTPTFTIPIILINHPGFLSTKILLSQPLFYPILRRTK
jgi:hypothetical protein